MEVKRKNKLFSKIGFIGERNKHRIDMLISINDREKIKVVLVIIKIFRMSLHKIKSHLRCFISILISIQQ